MHLFSYNKNGVEAGLYVDIWKLWAKYNNYNIEFVNGKLLGKCHKNGTR